MVGLCRLAPFTAPVHFNPRAAAGVPPGVLNIVHGLGATVGGPLVAHAGVKAVSFTGGTATGRLVAAAAATSFKKVSLELGGEHLEHGLPFHNMAVSSFIVVIAVFTCRQKSFCRVRGLRRGQSAGGGGSSWFSQSG